MIVLYLPTDWSSLIEITKLYLVYKYLDISDRIIFLLDSSKEKYKMSTFTSSGQSSASRYNIGLCINRYLPNFDLPTPVEAVSK